MYRETPPTVRPASQTARTTYRRVGAGYPWPGQSRQSAAPRRRSTRLNLRSRSSSGAVAASGSEDRPSVCEARSQRHLPEGGRRDPLSRAAQRDGAAGARQMALQVTLRGVTGRRRRDRLCTAHRPPVSQSRPSGVRAQPSTARHGQSTVRARPEHGRSTAAYLNDGGGNAWPGQRRATADRAPAVVLDVSTREFSCGAVAATGSVRPWRVLGYLSAQPETLVPVRTRY